MSDGVRNTNTGIGLIIFGIICCFIHAAPLGVICIIVGIILIATAGSAEAKHMDRIDRELGTGKYAPKGTQSYSHTDGKRVEGQGFPKN